ncbi:MAG: hypothetical protein HZA62_08205 [Rhodocyclales bacterium]|nr:hypothetical protein [Rhodocyclales bacterium]
MNEQVRFFLSRESKRKINSAIIVAVLTVLTVGQAHAAFLLVVLALPISAWLAWSVYIIVRRPYARLAQIICIFVWMVAFLLVFAAHFTRHELVRSDANQVVREIRRHIADYGRCPPQLLALGYKQQDLIDRLGENFGYSCENRKPRFFYVATFTIFDTFEYDFEQSTWDYVSWAEKKKFLDTRPTGLATESVDPSGVAPAPGSRSAPRRTP